MKFKVIDITTGREVSADVIDKIAKEYGLMEMDIDEFSINEDGNLLLSDDCGKSAYVDAEKYHLMPVFEGKYPNLRTLKKELCDGRVLSIEPNTIGDVTKIDAPDESFSLVIFDPPHLEVGSGWQRDKYGKLPPEWKKWMNTAFNECWRVLKSNGTMVFKWYEYHISLTEVLKCFDQKPILGNRRPKLSKTHWLLFFKENSNGWT